jgi:aerobic carbon-monoxide dehydrogenase small subunit
LSQGPAKQGITFTVNGEKKTVHSHPMERLLDVLRFELKLTGTKEGCGEGECGACGVLLDDELVDSCLIPVMQAEGTNIVTIEGIAQDARFRSLQDAFLETGGAQCGICTPGMIVAAAHLLKSNPNPSFEQIREALSGNLCRCTGYIQIFEAVAEAAQRLTS